MTVTSSRSLSLLLILFVFELALAAPAMLVEAAEPVLLNDACLIEDALFELIWSELLVPLPAVVDPAR